MRVIRRNRRRLSPLALALTPLCLGAALIAAPTQDAPPRESPPLQDRQSERGDERGGESRWLDRLPREDRAALDLVVGYVAPAIADDVEWINGEARSFESLRGKVVVLQSFSLRGARTMPQRFAATLSELRSDDLVLLALHTPDGADRAKLGLERLDLDIPILLDPSGVTSDRLGVFRRPVNLVIDRVGNVRFAGLTEPGLRSAVEMLLAERPEPNATPRDRTEPTPTDVRFPTFTDPVRGARDLRGQQSPPFHVDHWIKDEGEPSGRLTIIDFWATWCGPCLRAIPHMNEIANHYGDRIFIVGLSDENRGAFERGMLQRNLRTNGFSYSLGLDPDRNMMRAFGVQSIPNLAVISGDGVVRWQGHPNGLTRAVLDPLVEANELLRRGSGDSSPAAPPARWQQARR